MTSRLAVGFLLNQNMLRFGDVISGIEYEDDLDVVVVRTTGKQILKVLKKKRSLQVARGTVFCDLMDKLQHFIIIIRLAFEHLGCTNY